MSAIRELNNAEMKRIFGRVEIATMLKKIRGQKLKQTEKNYLYRSIRPKLAAALRISQSGIPAAIQQPKKGDSALIEYNLAQYGIPFFPIKQKKAKKLGLEKLIVSILTYSPHARYIEAIPLLLAKNPADPLMLLELAIENGVKNKLGYLIETSQMLKRREEYGRILSYLEQTKGQTTDFLVEGDQDFLLKTTPPRVRKWNLLGRFFDEDFKRNAKAYLC